jgi:hypothetical protein
MDLLAVLPVLGPSPVVAGHDLLERCLRDVLNSGAAKHVVVLADDPAALDAARRLGAQALLRPSEFLSADIGVERALQFALAACEAGDRHFDAVLYANPLFPFRPRGFFAELCARFAESGADSLVPCLRDYTPHWRETEQGLVRADSGELTRSRIKPTQRGLVGLGTLSSSEFVRQGRLLGDNIGLTPLDGKLYSLKANDPFDRAVIRLALDKGIKEFE